MHEIFRIILSHISALFSLVPLMVALYNYKYIKDYFRPLFFYLVVSVIVEAIAFVLRLGNTSPKMLPYIYTLLEFTFLSLFYSMLFRHYFKPIIFNLLIILFPIISFLLCQIFEFRSGDHYSVAIEAIVMISYCLFLFYYILKNLIFENLLQSPVFWINTGILFYFAGNFTIFIFGDFIASHREGAFPLLWKSIHTFFNISMNILFGIGFWKLRTK